MQARLPLMLGIVTTLGTAFVADDVVGRWAGETFAAGTMTSLTLELFPNGTYARRISSSTEFGWTREGDLLLIAPAVSRVDQQVSYGKAAAVQMRVSKEELVLSSGRHSITMKRVTWPVEGALLLGRWEGQSDQNEGVTQDFTADGRLIVTVTVSKEAGRYSVANNEIRFEEQIPFPGKKSSKFRMEKGKMILYFAPQLPPIELARILPDSTGR
jgi:hypothetical protein